MSFFSRFQWMVIVPTAVLIIAGMLVWWVLLGTPSEFMAELSAPLASPLPTLIETPLPSEWSTLVASSDPSSVAIQTFQGGLIVRYGTGTVMTSDGLIVTVADVVPYTSPSASYQVTARDRVLRASVVYRDHRRNLALLKADASDMTIARTVGTKPLVGSPLALVGGTIEVSQYRPFFGHAWLAESLQDHAVLDAAFIPMLAGGRVLASDGRQVGIAYLRSGRVLMVWMEDIDALVSEYLEGSQ